MLAVPVRALYKLTPKCMDRHLKDQMCRLQLKAGMRPVHVPYNMNNGALLIGAVAEPRHD